MRKSSKLLSLRLELAGDRGHAVDATWDDGVQVRTDQLTLDEALGHLLALAIPADRAGVGLFPGFRLRDLGRVVELEREIAAACDRRSAEERGSVAFAVAQADVDRLTAERQGLRVLGHPPIAGERRYVHASDEVTQMLAIAPARWPILAHYWPTRQPLPDLDVHWSHAGEPRENYCQVFRTHLTTADPLADHLDAIEFALLTGRHAKARASDQAPYVRTLGGIEEFPELYPNGCLRLYEPPTHYGTFYLTELTLSPVP